jgi:hypothetical protein
MPVQFPANLPRASNKLSLGVKDATIRSVFDTGRSRQRSRFESKNTFYSVKWVLNDDEYSTFDAFHRLAIDNGNDFFDVELPTGSGVEVVTARIVGGDYKIASKGVFNWVITAQLEVLSTL